MRYLSWSVTIDLRHLAKSFSEAILIPLLFRCNLQQNLKIVFFGGFVPALLAAARAAEEDAVLAAYYLYVDGFHHTAAGFFPVAGVDVDVPAPQAGRAVVGVPTALHLMAAVVAGEVFYPALEFPAHGYLWFLFCSS
jgi:hypothetical protein